MKKNPFTKFFSHISAVVGLTVMSCIEKAFGSEFFERPDDLDTRH